MKLVTVLFGPEVLLDEGFAAAEDIRQCRVLLTGHGLLELKKNQTGRVSQHATAEERLANSSSLCWPQNGRNAPSII